MSTVVFKLSGILMYFKSSLVGVYSSSAPALRYSKRIGSSVTLGDC